MKQIGLEYEIKRRQHNYSTNPKSASIYVESNTLERTMMHNNMIKYHKNRLQSHHKRNQSKMKLNAKYLNLNKSLFGDDIKPIKIRRYKKSQY